MAIAQELTASYREIIRLKIKGLSTSEIAQIVDMNPSSVSHIANSPMVKEHIENLQNKVDGLVVEASRDLTRMLPDVVEMYHKIINSPSESTADKIRIGESILDRVGLPKTKKELRESKGTFLNTFDILNLRKAISPTDIITVEGVQQNA